MLETQTTPEVIAIPKLVADVCYAILKGTADESTIRACQEAGDELWKKYDILRLVAGANLKYVNDLKDEAAPLIAEVFGGKQ